MFISNVFLVNLNRVPQDGFTTQALDIRDIPCKCLNFGFRIPYVGVLVIQHNHVDVTRDCVLWRGGRYVLPALLERYLPANGPGQRQGVCFNLLKL